MKDVIFYLPNGAFCFLLVSMTTGSYHSQGLRWLRYLQIFASIGLPDFRKPQGTSLSFCGCQATFNPRVSGDSRLHPCVGSNKGSRFYQLALGPVPCWVIMSLKSSLRLLWRHRCWDRTSFDLTSALPIPPLSQWAILSLRSNIKQTTG